MNFTQKTYGGLECYVADALPAGQTPQRIVVLCHGFGAPGTDLVGLAGELVRLAPTLGDTTRFVFPAGSLALDAQGLPGGRAWWPIDMAVLTAAIESGQFRDQRQYFPEELPEIRRSMLAMIGEIRDENGGAIDTLPFAIGGFSQGSMVAVETALHMDPPPAALFVFSGTLLCEERWRELAVNLRGKAVLQSHGRQDPLLPFSAAVWLADLLLKAGADVRFIEFDGFHTIPSDVLSTAAELLKDS